MCQKTTPTSGNEEVVRRGHKKRTISASLTVRWNWKRMRWEADHVYFWYDKKRLWSCRSDDGRYYYGFSSFRKVLKSYVGGILCEKIRDYAMEKAEVNYRYVRYPLQLSCRVTTRYTEPPQVEQFIGKE